MKKKKRFRVEVVSIRTGKVALTIGRGMSEDKAELTQAEGAIRFDPTKYLVQTVKEGEEL